MPTNDTKFHSKQEFLANEIFEAQEMLPSRYIFILTNQCNLKCTFCFQSKESKNNQMNMADWQNVISQLPKYSRVTLTGGEPLIAKDFMKIFDAVSKNFDCNIITNGLMMDKEMTDFILSADKLKVVSISIDDIGNRSRNFTKNQWNKLESNIEYFVKKRNLLGKDVILDIKTLVLDETCSEIFDIYKYCVEKLKCDTHVFQFLKGSPLQSSDVMYQFDDVNIAKKAYKYKNIAIIKDELNKVQKYNQEYNLVSYMHPKICDLSSEASLDFLDTLCDSYFQKDDFLPCKMPWASVYINYDGEIFPCLAVSMGNVKQMTINDIIFGKDFTKFKRLLMEEKLFASCIRCGWLRLNG